MRKLKFFASIFKERDWLEEMAQKGWIFQDITWGILYHFKKSEPCEKVFEVERFGASNHPKIQEINARRLALDVANQAGWQVVTHDEEMNYYFMKDKAYDETDEFYDDEELRKDRAERFRKRYAYEMPTAFLAMDLFVTVLYMLVFAMLVILNSNYYKYLSGFYLVYVFIEVAIVLFYLWWGNKMYEELNLSREQWELRKNTEKTPKFKKVKELRAFLQEKNQQGFVLSAYENKKLLFEQSAVKYDYCIDTRPALQKRLKKQGNTFKREKKDWQGQSLKWYEMSIEEAGKHNFTPVCVVGQDVLVYKRPHSDKELPWENDDKKMGFLHNFPKMVVGLFMLMLVSCMAGYISGMLFK